MRFTVQAPDGRKITLEGDTAPTESDLNQIFGIQQEPQKDYTLGRVAALDSGATFGFGRKLGGLINAIGSYPVDRIAEAMGKENTPSFKDRYNEIVDPVVEAKKEYEQDKPVEAFGLELASSFANPVNIKAAGTIAKGATKTAKALRSIGAGSAVGGLSAIGATENLEDLPANTIKGTATGGAVGAVIPLAGMAIRGTGKALKQVLGKTTGAGDVAIADAFKAGQNAEKVFLDKMKGSIDAEGLERKVQNNFDKIKKARNMTYDDDITRLKQATYNKKLDINPVINDVKAIIRQEGGGAEYLVDDDTARVLSKTKETLNNFYKDKSRHNLEGFDNLKKALQNINTREGTNAERVKTQITNSVKGQILKQSPEYKAINDLYARDTELLNDLKKVFSLNRNANSETVLRKIQSTARNNANTDWSYRAQLLKKLDPAGEIQKEISANALNTWTPRGGLGGIVGFGGLFARDPVLIAASSPRAVGYGAYGLGRLSSAMPNVQASKISPYVAQLIGAE